MLKGEIIIEAVPRGYDSRPNTIFFDRGSCHDERTVRHRRYFEAGLRHGPVSLSEGGCFATMRP